MSGTIVGSNYQIPGYIGIAVLGTTDSGPFGSLADGDGFYSSNGTVTTVAVPGYVTTDIFGADASGDTAYGVASTPSGARSDTWPPYSRFVDVGGTFTLLPTNETPVGVDDNGDVLIDVQPTNSGAPGQSFLLNHGIGTPIALPGYDVQATAISPSGVIAGAVSPEQNGLTQYFVGRPGSYAIYDYPYLSGSLGDAPTAVNDSSAVGLNGQSGYAAVVQDGVVEDVENDANDELVVVALNAEGDAIVVQTGNDDELVVTPTGLTYEVDVPGASFVHVEGITDQGEIFGSYATYSGSFSAQLPCFAAGTLISAHAGEIAVEDVRVGELMRTAGGELRPVVWIGHRQVDLASHPKPELARPVVIRRGAFAPNLPRRDLLVSPDHNIAFEDVLIPAKCLVNGLNVVVDTAAASVTYHHVELATHDLVLAEGLAAETFLDVGNRASLSPEANGMADFSSTVDAQWFRWEALGCRRLVLVGSELDRARAALHTRARGHARLAIGVPNTAAKLPVGRRDVTVAALA